MKRSMRAALAALAVVAVPFAAAPVAQASSGSPVAQARHATAQLGSLTHAGQASQAAVALRSARHSLAAAGKWAHGLPTDSAVSAAAFEQVAQGYQALITQCASLVTTAPASLQSALAQCLAPSINGREQALATLQQLVSALPDPFKSQVAAVLAQLTAQTGDPTAVLTGALQSGQLPPAVSGVVSQALATVSSLVGVAVGQLQSLLGMLPAAAQAPVQQALATVSGVLQMVQQQLQSLLSGLPAGGVVAGPLAQVLGIISQLVGGLAGPSTGGAGTGSSPVGAVPGVSSLISSLLGTLPGGLGGLLGGLLPHAAR